MNKTYCDICGKEIVLLPNVMEMRFRHGSKTSCDCCDKCFELLSRMIETIKYFKEK
mgnify:CR=1 FL=1